tara:strand:+ start:172 stop:606 length:435 start_codon:yes stop_codon:yes gene_type:complete
MHFIEMEIVKFANHTYDETIDFEVEWDFTIGDINDIAGELNSLGWDYFSAGGYMGWNKSASNTKVYELNGETLRSILFCYDTEMNITIDFTNVEKGIFEVKMYHHDSPTGETVYFVRETSIDADDEWDNPREHCIDVAIEKGLR